MLLSFERVIVGVFAFVIPRATLLHCERSGARSPAGVEEHAQRDKWVSPGTWEVLSSPRQFPGWSYRVTNSRPRRWVLVRRGAKRTSANRGTTKRRQRSAVGWAAGSHSTLIVPRKPGNWSRGTRWREGKTVRGCLMLDPGPGTTSKALYLETRITVTTQDSKPGMQRLVVWRIHHQRNRML